jgi:hypothetical protein
LLGNGVEVLGWMLLMLFGVILIVPGAWVLAAYCRWFCRNLRFSDGSTAQFPGRGGEILGWWVLAVLVGGIRLGIPGIDVGHVQISIGVGFFVGSYGWLQIMRWMASRVEHSSGARFSFHGTYWELLGWHILNALAVVTIVGWAWSLAAMYRWMARSTRAKGRVLQFHGEGHQVLWRVLAMILMCLPVLTIPWALLWYTRWIVENVTIERDLEDRGDA